MSADGTPESGENSGRLKMLFNTGNVLPKDLDSDQAASILE
jgi:hypothetical protein